MIENLLFHELFTQLLELNSYKNVVDFKNKTGIKNSVKSLRGYKNGKIVPSYDTAKAILEQLNYNENIDGLIKHSNEVIKETRFDENDKIKQGIYLNPSKIMGEGYNAADLSQFIETRMTEITGEPQTSKGRISSYISYLIEKDYQENK